ncbi:MAG: Rrf2 family transcriptional regulator [Verrucomicrobiaceae bacterium]|nr:MAG: Rrf2 family transcriptional regulator [Verrucomicrobiaceae bacterium]
MFIYGKTSSNAIAVMSFLAEDPSRRVGSGEIASARKISRALTAKLLTQLAAAGLVHGQPGPGGGYTLAKPAKKICLLDIASLFEQTEPPSLCPFGHDWCGKGEPCPLHNMIAGMIDSNRDFMKKTSLAIFEGQQPRMPAKGSPVGTKIRFRKTPRTT